MKLSISPKLSDAFRQNIYSMCQIDATDCTESFVVITYAVHELSQKSGTG